jgi:hypothetical protein
MRTLLSALFLFTLTLNLTTSANARVNNSIEGLWLNLSNVEELGVSCADYGDVYSVIDGKEQITFSKSGDTCLYEVSSNVELNRVKEVALLAPSAESCYYAGGVVFENYSNKNFDLLYTSWNFEGKGAYCYFQLLK